MEEVTEMDLEATTSPSTLSNDPSVVLAEALSSQPIRQFFAVDTEDPKTDSPNVLCEVPTSRVPLVLILPPIQVSNRADRELSTKTCECTDKAAPNEEVRRTVKSRLTWQSFATDIDDIHMRESIAETDPPIIRPCMSRISEPKTD
jgi:hypothetical protein